MLEVFQLVAFLLRISRAVRFARLAILGALVTGLASGVGYMALVALINEILASRSGADLLDRFIALAIAVSIVRMISQALFDWIGARAVFDLRLQLSRRILGAPLRSLEEIGPPRFLAALTEDVTALTNALVQVPRFCMYVAIVLACLIYLGTLSWKLLLFILVFMVVGIASFQLAMFRARGYFKRLRERTDALFAQFRGLIHGAKELKLHRRRREVFLSSELVPTGREIRKLTLAGNLIFTATAVWGNLLFFIAIGILLFALFGRWQIGQEVLMGYTLVLLYLMTPLEIILLSLPIVARATVAARKLERLGLRLAKDAGAPASKGELIPPSWNRLELVGVTHAYPGEDGVSAFKLGPVDLAFEPGQIVFLVGGNGSGKTTLAKVLMGLYAPEEGEIRLNGRALTEEDRNAYRQLFSAVFADYYLFESLIGGKDVDLEQSAPGYLARLELEKKVKVENGVLSTLNLSQGQRKRLALLAAYLEDRPVYFFDEWAADQDPQFKAIFYREILPELKARGKTVFVISHDDQYYSVADRLIKLDYGQVEQDLAGSASRMFTGEDLAGAALLR